MALVDDAKPVNDRESDAARDRVPQPVVRAESSQRATPGCSGALRTVTERGFRHG